MTELAAPEAELETVVVDAVAEHAVTVAHTVAQLEVVVPEIEEIAQEAVHCDTAEALHEDEEEEEEEDEDEESWLAVEDAKLSLAVDVGSSGKSASSGYMSRDIKGGNISAGGSIPEITGKTKWHAASRTPLITSLAT
jgi:hypothetical protein